MNSGTQNDFIEITPNPAFIDEEVRIRVHGLAPRQPLILRATTEDDLRRRWTAQAEFRADESGCVDPAVLAPTVGAYRGISAMGIFWSMRLEAEPASGSAAFAKNNPQPNFVGIEAESRGRILASAKIERRFLAPGTETRDLKIDDSAEGFSGRLFLPPIEGAARPPVIIVLSGSGGGFDLDKAAVLSRHGFATLALAYFGIPPLPQWLHRIPLEYFEAAMAWLAAQPEIDCRRLGVLGVSRGAELALLLAATFPQIRSVAAFAPSHVAWAAGGREKESGEIIPVWTYRGKPIPFAPLPLRGFMLRSAFPVVALRRPVIFRNLFRAGMRNREALREAAIPVERMRGPVLLVSGGDDHVWPADRMSEAIVERLRENHFPHAVQHLRYPRAGHMLRYPFLPTTARNSRNAHLRNARFSFGGTAAADAQAQAESWPRTIAFFRESFRE
jgi:dienelactone hydrolase